MWFDLVVVAILLFTTLRGAVKGIVWQLAAIGSLLLCFVFAQSGSLALSPMIPLEAPLNRWTAMFLIYIFFSFIAFGTARMLREGIEKAKFVEYDRHLGAILGFVKGAVICLVMTFFSVTMSDSLRAAVLNSYSGGHAIALMDRLAPVLPDELHNIIDPALRKLNAETGDTRYGHHHNDHHAGEPDFDEPFPPPNGGSKPNAQDPFGDPFGFDPNERRRDGFDPLPPAPTDRGADPLSGRQNDPLADPFDPRSAQDPFDRPLDPRPRELPQSREPLMSNSEVVQDLANRLAGAADAEMKRRVLDALNRTSPEDRRELVDKLGAALPGMIRTIAEEWKDGRPATNASVPERDRLLKEISAVYSDFPDSQAAAREEFEESLKDVPDSVAIAVLRDWHADLFSVSRDEDPDPSTGINTSLDTRIVKQLAAARVPVSTLSATLQNRLRNAQRR